ncbi:MAG: hypothetical protein QG640_455 [Patescibacteria group bacterium]|nr:hypothetical protein [Patescibacteria group bacterium]
MKNYANKGFTLIELLVVIAIIGILSSVVLASLSGARAKAGDTAIKANLATLRVQSEFYYDSHANKYGVMASSTITSAGLCSATPAGLYTDTTIQNALKTALIQSGNPTSAYCASTDTTWSVSIPMKSDSAISWCVGNIGKASTITTPASAAAFAGCPG